MNNWQREGIDIQLSVNVSIRDVEASDFAPMVAELCEEHDVAATQLGIEITESALMVDPGSVVENLEALRSLGVAIALDDFGTGQSSLSYLSNLPSDFLKLDAAFAQQVIGNTRIEVVIKAAIDAAHSLGQKVVAEGVENTEVLVRLHELSCDYAQGYLLSRPLPEPSFRAWLLDSQIKALRSSRGRPMIESFGSPARTASSQPNSKVRVNRRHY